MKQKTFSLLVSIVIICALLPVCVIGCLQHLDIEANWLKNLDVQWYNLCGFQALDPLLFAKIARFPCSKHFHELSALVDKFHTCSFNNFM